MIELPATTKRVQNHTPEHINKEIQEEIERRIEYYRGRNEKDIKKRIASLEKEWNTERVLEANASTLVIIGSIMGASVSRKWNLLPAIVGTFLLQHAIQGWCPPLSVIRRLGIRTPGEINQEKSALEDLLK
ncbi:YgaP family membrane protein [Salinicoccus luteus]|uniref:YgaP family membrane protein n=1 Tax=Salinicoccus luteus TaxID=367840 RepID=UPI0004E25894|nr:DUF2892 domain-containing protein [Salinicoccus luteus]